MKVIESPPSHYPWILERLGRDGTSEFRALSAVDARGDIRGMVGFDRWTESAAEIHVALGTPIAARVLLQAAFRYLFGVCGKRSAFGLIADDNAESMALSKKLGFQQMGRIPDGFKPGVDCVLMTIHRDNCRWIGRAS